MDLRLLKVFCDAVQHQSFSAAAKLNRITQSAVSQQISLIERRLKLKLFDRSTRPFALTAAGHRYYDGCRPILERYAAVEEELRARDASIKGEVRVAAIYSVGLTRMGQILQELSRRFPDVSPRVSYLHPKQIYQDLQLDEIDLGIVSCPSKRKGITITPWVRQEMCAIQSLRANAAGLTEFTAQAVMGLPFIAFARGLAVRRLVDLYLRNIGVKVQVTMEFDNVETIKCAVEEGAGIAIVPAETISNEAKHGLLKPLTLPAPGLSRNLAILRRDTPVILRPVQALIDIMLLSRSPKLH